MKQALANKKILMISYTSFLQKYYQTLPHEIARISGAKIKVLVPAFWKELWSDGKKYLEKEYDPLYEIIKGKITFAGNLHFSFFRNKLKQMVSDFKPDIIDLDNEPFNAGSFQLVVYRNLLSPQSKIILHASQNKYKHYPPPFNLFEKHVLKHTDIILARNQAAIKVLQKKEFKGKIELLTHGVDTNVFKPVDQYNTKQTYVSDEKPLIGYVGALEDHKGVKYLIQSLEGINCNLLVIGDGKQKEALQKLAKNLNINAQFIAAVPHEKIPFYMNRMDIFILPSITKPSCSEKFGRVLIEAMACGVPIIVSDSGELANVLADGR
jgi:glycosyltransferase involved in cell wall biosynthesis